MLLIYNYNMFYVYVDWTTEDSPRPFYVGKGNISRTRKLKRNDLHERIAKKYGIKREIIFESDEEELCLFKEIETISLLKTFVNDENYNQIGCNFTIGGEGTTGCKYSEESKRVLSESRKGIQFTQEHIERIRNSLKGRKLPEDVKEKMSRSRKGKRPAACDLNVGKKRTDESKAKLSEKAKEREAKKRMERQQRLHPHEEQVTQPSL
jgi:hypothetical protein